MTITELLRADPARAADDLLPTLLRVIRSHLEMEVAFISELTAERRIFRHVDRVEGAPNLAVGGSDPLEDSYCVRVVDGRLPQLMRNAQEIPAAAALAATWTVPVGAHLSVPLRLSDGTVYGTFCCMSRRPDPSLTERDVAMMRAFAELAATHIEGRLAQSRRLAQTRQRVVSLLEDPSGLTSVYQPIQDLAACAVAGFECLSRFSAPPAQGPDVWFAEATSVGLGSELELKAIATALQGLHALERGAYLSLNLSPSIPAEGLWALLAPWDKARLVLEITEHEVIEQYDALEHTLRPLREHGLRVAVDDAGAGYASFRHILRLRPDFIKLDLSLTRDIDTDPARRALAAALVRFAADTGSDIIAEGVETAAELRALRALGISKAQGYYLGKPGALPRSR